MASSEPPGHTHLLCDLWFEESEILKYVAPLRAAIIEAARAGGAHVLHSHFHQFRPWGVTGFLLLCESHISVHTWVEERYAALDVFGCGSMDHAGIVRILVERLGPEQVTLLNVRRGVQSKLVSACQVPGT
jgi:S-adenosylmethionine decarboxylase